MKQEYVKLKPKSPIAQAIAYSIKRWDGLSLYASTNHLHIDNNPIERCMKTWLSDAKTTCSVARMKRPKEQASYTRCWLPANLIP